MYPVSADDSLRTAFVSLLKPDGTVVGGGVLVTDENAVVSVLTCAHVVNMALGRHQFASDKPASDSVTVAFPSVPGQRCSAHVTGWWPARSLRDEEETLSGTERRWRGDISTLRVADALPKQVRPVRLAAPSLGQSAWSWFGSGEPTSVVRVHVSAVADDWLVLSGAPTGHAVQPGYSGSPLWDRKLQAVVGILVSAHHSLPYSRLTTADIIRQSYAIRADIIAERCLAHGPKQRLLPGEVQSLLNAQRSAARSFPYRAIGLHGRDPSAVYVRQQVSTSDNAAAALATDPEQASAAPDLVVPETEVNRRGPCHTPAPVPDGRSGFRKIHSDPSISDPSRRAPKGRRRCRYPPARPVAGEGSGSPSRNAPSRCGVRCPRGEPCEVPGTRPRSATVGTARAWIALALGHRRLGRGHLASRSRRPNRTPTGLHGDGARVPRSDHQPSLT